MRKCWVVLGNLGEHCQDVETQEEVTRAGQATEDDRSQDKTKMMRCEDVCIRKS